MAKVYLTGASGFIGKALKEQLMSSLPFDYTHIPHDKIQTTKLKSFDYFFFLSTYGNLHHHTDEDAIFKANVEDLLSILTQIKDKPFKSFVYMSTSSVRLKTQTTYSRSKRAAEQILFAFKDKYNLPIAIIRPFSVTGAGEQEEHLIPSLIRSALYDEEMDFVKEPVHDFIDVEDVAKGLVNLAENSAKGIFELGTGKAVSNQEVLETVESVTGKYVNAHLVNSLRSYDTDKWVSTKFKARSYGWLPRKSLKQSIEESVREIKNG